MRDRSATAARDRAMVELANSQYGIVDLSELLGLGIEKRAAWRRVQSGRLHRLHLGVYSIVPPRLMRAEGRWLAGVRAAGGDAALSYAFAVAPWDLQGPPSGPVHVTVPSDSGRRRRPGLVVHRCPSLTRGEITTRRGIPVTSCARTLRDVQRIWPASRFEAVLRKAEQRHLDTGVFGAIEDGDVTELERRLLALCRRHGLPLPRKQVVIGPHTVDFLWPEARLIVEADDFGTHGTRTGFEGDRARDAWQMPQGYRVVRFTWRQLREDPAGVVATLKALLGLPP